MALENIAYYTKKPQMEGTCTEANILKYWKAKAVVKTKAALFQYIVRNDDRHLAAFLNEFGTNSYVHAAQLHSALWGSYTDPDKNLEALIRQEQEHILSFSAYAKDAREEGFEEIASIFDELTIIAQAQASKLTDIITKVQESSIFAKETEQEWYCTRCGHVHRGLEAPETCPLCQNPRRYFEIKGANFSTF